MKVQDQKWIVANEARGKICIDEDDVRAVTGWLKKEDGYLIAASPAMYKKLEHLAKNCQSVSQEEKLEILAILSIARGEQCKP